MGGKPKFMKLDYQKIKTLVVRLEEVNGMISFCEGEFQ